MSLVVDTHSFIWFLARSSDLSSVARQAIREAITSGHPVYVSSVTIVEVIYLNAWCEICRITSQSNQQKPIGVVRI